MIVMVTLVFSALLLLFFYICTTQSRKLLARLQQAQQEESRTRIAALDEGLRDWLRTLEIPILGDQKKLEAAAHQLRKVLVERLMSGPRER